MNDLCNNNYKKSNLASTTCFNHSDKELLVISEIRPLNRVMVMLLAHNSVEPVYWSSVIFIIILGKSRISAFIKCANMLIYLEYKGSALYFHAVIVSNEWNTSHTLQVWKYHK